MLRHLSLQSKLILILLAVCLLTAIPIAYVGYTSGRDSMQKCVTEELTGQRRTRTNQCKTFLETTRNQVVTQSNGQDALLALTEFGKAHAALRAEKAPLSAAEEAGLRQFYTGTFLPGLKANSDAEPLLETVYPTDPAARYLHYHYIAKFPDVPYEQKGKVLSANVESAYDVAHRKYHPFLSEFAAAFGFEDLMLVDLDGNVVYTAQKTTEFGTNLLTGPYSNTNLAETYRDLRKAQERDAYKFVDFERYKPNLNKPSAFVASPIHADGRMAGIMVVQFPIEPLVKILTGGYQWKAEGLGDTGEVYLVGKDKLFRTRSRFMYEDKDAALAAFEKSGVPAGPLAQVRRQQSVILALPADTEGVREALAGREGTAEYTDYRGEPVVGSYGPLDFDGVRWAVLAEMDATEAYAPVADFRRTVVITATALAVAVSILGLLLSYLFTAPVRALTLAAKKVADGQVGAQAEVRARDEFGDLAEAFNRMSLGLKEKTDQLEHKVRENEELLLNILPAPAAARLREGGDAGTQTFADVTVLFAEVVGLDALIERLGTDHGLQQFKELVLAFDDAAERFGAEKVRTSGVTYLVVCGLSVQRPDHTTRVVEFALELVKIVERFNRERQAGLSVQIGVNAGPVTGGVVGRHKFIYDLWGETVSIASGLRGGVGSAVRLTKAVHDRLNGLLPVADRQTCEVKGKAVECWPVVLS